MKSGLVSIKGFVSSFALIILMYVFSFGYVHYKIISNLIVMQKKSEQLEIKTYLEVILVHRIRDSYLNNEIKNEESFTFQPYDISVKYSGNVVIIEFDDSTIKSYVEYEYDDSAKNLIRK